MRHSCPFAPLLAFTVSLPGAAPVFAQDAWDPARVYASRGALDSLAHRLELAAGSPAYSAVLRAQASEEASDLRARLRDGDFQVGDRIMLQVEREEAYSDSFVVEEGPMIRLPTIGEVSLAGVLRSEMEAHLTRELARYIRDPVVRARTSIRIAVLGAVGRPGFYAMPVQYLVTDVLAGAGQVSGNADIGKISIERAGKAIWSNEQLEPEIIEGRTLDQLGVRAGDRIVVGSKRRFLSVLQSSQSFLYLFLGLPPAIIGFITLIT